MGEQLLATVGFRCLGCGWSISYPLTISDMASNRGVCLWVPCGQCEGYAYQTGVSRGVITESPAQPGSSAVNLFRDIGIRWEDA